MFFPNIRLRRMRTNQFSRDMISENNVTVKDLIFPMFVCEGRKKKEKIPSMPNINRLSIDLIVEKCRKIRDLIIKENFFTRSEVRTAI